MAIIRQREKLRPGRAAVVGAGSINPGATSTVVTAYSAALAPTTARVSGLGARIPYVAPYTAPSWGTIPTLTFVNGVASSASIASYLTEGNYAAATLTATGTALPAGVTLDATNKLLVYDGTAKAPLPSVTTGHTLTANDGYDTTGTAITTVIVEEPSGTMGVVLKKGDLPAGRYLTATGVTGWQAKVQTRWPDGSARIAVCSWNDGSISDGVNRTITLRSSASEASNLAVALATLRASGFNGSVVFTAGQLIPLPTPVQGIIGVDPGGTVTIDLAALIATTPFRQWQAGPQCSEWHWRAPVGSDPTLAIWLYVRLYASGAIWTRTMVENGYCKVTPQYGKRYHCAIILNGSTRYDTATDANQYWPQWNQERVAHEDGQAWYWPWTLGDPFPHSARSRWTKEFWYDGRALRTVCHDGLYLSATKLFPNYGWRETPTTMFGTHAQASVPGRLYFTIYAQSGSNGISLGHNYDYRYVLAPHVSDYQKQEFKSMVAFSEEFGHRGQWYRDENTYEPVLWTDRPNLLGSVSVSDSNSVSYPGVYVAPTGSPTAPYYAYRHVVPTSGDRAHDPLWGFSAYLTTGDYFHLETLQMRATTQWAGYSYLDREGVKGIMMGRSQDQTRAFAWSFRTLGAAAVCTPDVPDAPAYQQAIRTCYLNSLFYTCERQVKQFVEGSLTGTLAGFNCVNSLGRVYSTVAGQNLAYYGVGNLAGWQGEAPWQQNFCAAAIARVEQFEIMSGDQATMLGRLCDHTLKWPVGMLGPGDNTGWPYSHGGAYSIPMAKKVNNVWTYPADWYEAYSWYLEIYPAVPDQRMVTLTEPTGAPFLATTFAMIPESDPMIHNGYAQKADSWPGYFWGSLHAALAAALERGQPGATDALARMQSLTGPDAGMTPAGDVGYTNHAAWFHKAPLWGEVPRT
jgi:hypothetical protein